MHDIYWGTIYANNGKREVEITTFILVRENVDPANDNIWKVKQRGYVGYKITKIKLHEFVSKTAWS